MDSLQRRLKRQKDALRKQEMERRKKEDEERAAERARKQKEKQATKKQAPMFVRPRQKKYFSSSDTDDDDDALLARATAEKEAPPKLKEPPPRSNNNNVSSFAAAPISNKPAVQLPPRPAARNSHVPSAVGLTSASKGSPASSISFSQSPGRRKFSTASPISFSQSPIQTATAAAAPAQRNNKRTLQFAASSSDDDSDDDDDDDAALMKKFLANQKQREKNQQRAKSRMGRTSTSDDGKASPSESQESKASAAKPNGRRRSPSLYPGERGDSEDEEARKARSRRSLYPGERSDDEQEARKERRRRQSPEGSSSSSEESSLQRKKSPRNPITYQENFKAAASSSSPPLALQSSNGKNDDELWDDSEDEHVQQQQTTATKKKRSNKRGTGSSSRPQDEPTISRSTGLATLDEDIDESERKPEFSVPKFGPFADEPLVLDDDNQFSVPASINRYLPEYQQQGIRFLYQRARHAQKQGGILGDDMGLGKTIQVISLLSALLLKKGTGADLAELHRRKRRADELVAQAELQREQAAFQGLPWIDGVDGGSASKLGLPEWAPVLILIPTSVINNWVQDFDTWGHFSVATYSGGTREKAYQSIKDGIAEVLLCPHSLFQKEEHVANLKKIQWKLVVIDEFHLFKNRKKYLATHLRSLRDETKCVVLGLTGTPMQNDHEELWNLVDLVAKNYLGPWDDFKRQYAIPIKHGRRKDSDDAVKQRAKQKGEEFSEKLYKLFLRRTKFDVLKEHLPNKDERIIFCELSDLQKRLYKHIIQQPDYILLSRANGPCECGINQKFFVEYQQLKTDKERLEYQRIHKDDIQRRCKCCHVTPGYEDKAEGGDAVLWRQAHPEGVDECEDCPFCIFFKALHILYKLSSHAGLLQVPTAPEHYRAGSTERTKAEQHLEWAQKLIPPEELQYLPGGSYIAKDGIMNDHFALSGKMRILDKLLEMIDRKQGRVLLFSASTKVLDLIQNYLRSKGFSHLRVDGTTPRVKRTEIVADFKRNNDCFVFLLSTKAMSMGLNLTEANYVILFDVEWNPSYDNQAQDRSFRIGQQKDVTVYRLVSRGTIEELKYLRQVYKTQLEQETIIDLDVDSREAAARLFRGVAGDPTRRGELFGITNILKFKDGNFMNYSSDACDAHKYANVKTHTRSNLLETVEHEGAEEVVDYLGLDGMVFDNMAHKKCKGDLKKDEAENESDEESVVGGESQMVMDICDRVDLPPIQEEEEEEDAAMEQAPADEAVPALGGASKVPSNAAAIVDEPKRDVPDRPVSAQGSSGATRANTSNGAATHQAHSVRSDSATIPVKPTSNGSADRVGQSTARAGPRPTMSRAAPAESGGSTVAKREERNKSPQSGDITKKRKASRNHTVCGLPVTKYKKGKTGGGTTFTLADLPLPAGFKRSSKKK